MRSAPPHLSLDTTDQSSLGNEADAISGAASGAPFACRSRRSIGLRASPEEEAHSSVRLEQGTILRKSAQRSGSFRARYQLKLGEARTLLAT